VVGDRSGSRTISAPLREPPDIALTDKTETRTMRTRSIAMLLAIAALAVLPGRAAQASELSEIRDSQKQILVGKGGAMVKDIGTRARPEIEALLGHPVYLELMVKVRPHWRRNKATLERLGL